MSSVELREEFLYWTILGPGPVFQNTNFPSKIPSKMTGTDMVDKDFYLRWGTHSSRHASQ